MNKYMLVIAGVLLCTSLSAQPLPKVTPDEVGMDIDKLKQTDILINDAIGDNEFPGAVLAVVRYGKIAYLKAYGNRQVVPNKEAMTTNIIFDLASLTKPTSTALAAMILIERGEMRLQDNVSFYFPHFEAWRTYDGKKKEVKIIDLMTHTSGLPAYAPVESLKKSKEATPQGIVNYINSVDRKSEPATKFVYSDLNYILLQAIIEKVSRQSLQNFVKENVYIPLGMNNTDYNPSGEMLNNIAPTQRQKDGHVLLGEVHDPLARVTLNGISGNAGLFSNAEDLAILATMILNQGRYNGKQIMSPLTTKAMYSVPQGYEEFGRTLGWDNFSSYSTNKGDLFSKYTFGHTGYTGTSIIIDPEYYTAVILLTNRVHPIDKGSLTRLRSLIANIVAGSIIEY